MLAIPRDPVRIFTLKMMYSSPQKEENKLLSAPRLPLFHTLVAPLHTLLPLGHPH